MLRQMRKTVSSCSGISSAHHAQDLNQWCQCAAASCHLSLHACNRSLFARGLSIDPRAYVISQHARWPIRTPRPTCTWVVITPKRKKVNFIHTDAWHYWTRTPACNIVQKAVFFLNTFSRLIYVPMAIVPFWFGGFVIVKAMTVALLAVKLVHLLQHISRDFLNGGFMGLEGITRKTGQLAIK